MVNDEQRFYWMQMPYYFFRTLSSTVFLYWMKMESKRLERVKARGKNFCEKELPSL